MKEIDIKKLEEVCTAVSWSFTTYWKGQKYSRL